MKKNNNKGYMLVEIILASVLAFLVIYFIIDLTVKMKNKNDDMFVKTLVTTDQTIVTKKLMDFATIEKTEFDCSKIEIDGNTVKYKGEIVGVLDEYADVADFSCKNEYGRVTINIPVTVKQLKEEDFDINVNYRYDNFDMIPPEILISGDLVKIYKVAFDLYEGVTITDDNDIISKKIYFKEEELTDSTTLPLGDNVITYEAIDEFGNVQRKDRNVKIIVASEEFNYKQSDQTYKVLVDGTYIVELYGAQGSAGGGHGGYVKAEIDLKKDDILYINTGGVNGYNGGGGYGNGNYNAGGGATTVRINGNYLAIAGGGGGAGARGTAGSGGSGNGNGGSNVGSGAGINGSNGGGGSNSKNYNYTCNCQSCCAYYNPTYRCCIQYDDHPDTPHCVLETTCGGGCGGYTSCNCQTCTTTGYSGSGGSNIVNSPARVVESSAGARGGNGYAKISYKI